MRSKGKKADTMAVNTPAEIEALDISMKPKELNLHLNKILDEVGKIEIKLPKDLLVPALGGDPGAELPGAEPEPVYDARARANIQGNTIPGFNKDHQHFLFYRLGNLRQAKGWLRWIAPLISSMEDVLAFVRAHRTMRLRLGVADPPMCATWVNIAFSHDAIARLTSKADADAFGDQSFRQGLTERSTYLGDPTKTSHPGHRRKWAVGGPRNEADILVIIAADDPEDLVTMVDAINRQAASAGLRLLFEQRGETLPGRLRGHEHFGFKDGISQPGVRGKVSPAPGDFITPRYIDTADPRARLFAKPGQPLVWPGQFLLGERRQHTEDLYASAPAAANFPGWAAFGSYLVCRRLRQDVPAFWTFAIGAAVALDIPPLQFASMMVGRWPSGAPVMRTPAADNAALAGDEWANNHFIYDDDTRPSSLRPIPGYGGDGFAQARADVLGAVCPHFAHIRKSNPRDSATDLGKPHDTLLRMILRRGIPFGPPLVGAKRPTLKLLRQERGLMFLCYGGTIEDQFEFLTRRWVNSPIQPNFGGHDPIIGQHDARGNRERFIDVPVAGGAKRVKLKDEWGHPHGRRLLLLAADPGDCGRAGGLKGESHDIIHCPRQETSSASADQRHCCSVDSRLTVCASFAPAQTVKCPFETADSKALTVCLLRSVKKKGESLPVLPAPLDWLVGQPTEFSRETLLHFLQAQSIPESDVGGSISTPLPAKVRFFVIHDTSSPFLGEKDFPSDINEKTWLGNNLKSQKAVAHVFVNRVGESVTKVRFEVGFRATKHELADIHQNGRKGMFVHVELIQPRRSDPAGPKNNDFIAPEPGFTQAQYDRLALLYVIASVRRGEWLLPGFHCAIDAGIPNAHDDPQNFDLNAWLNSLQTLLAKLGRN